jgi:hypothetical protein
MEYSPVCSVAKENIVININPTNKIIGCNCILLAFFTLPISFFEINFIKEYGINTSIRKSAIDTFLTNEQ